MDEANYLIIETDPERGTEELVAGNEAFDSYSEALNWLVTYNNLLAGEDSYIVDPIVNGHFFYHRLTKNFSPSRAVWIEAVD